MMNDFFSWEVLSTYSGAILATSLITQIFKGVPFIDKIPTKVFSFCIGLIVLLTAQIFTNNFSVPNLALSIINAVIVSLASNGVFDVTHNVSTKKKVENETDILG